LLLLVHDTSKENSIIWSEPWQKHNASHVFEFSQQTLFFKVPWDMFCSFQNSLPQIISKLLRPCFVGLNFFPSLTGTHSIFQVPRATFTTKSRKLCLIASKFLSCSCFPLSYFLSALLYLNSGPSSSSMTPFLKRYFTIFYTIIYLQCHCTSKNQTACNHSSKNSRKRISDWEKYPENRSRKKFFSSSQKYLSNTRFPALEFAYCNFSRPKHSENVSLLMAQFLFP
jgi:hypothetical protein